MESNVTDLLNLPGRDHRYNNFYIDSAHTKESIKFAIKRFQNDIGNSPMTLIFSQTKTSRDYLGFIDQIE